MNRESELKSKLMETIKASFPGFEALRHEDVRTSGIPDISLTGNKRTTWWEVKHAAPKIISKGIQELTMLRLASAGFARYIIFDERHDKRTLIVHPQDFKTLSAEAECLGFDYQWLIRYMREVHAHQAKHSDLSVIR